MQQTFKEYLGELSSAQAAKFSIKPRAERVSAAQTSDRDAKIAMQQDLERMEQGVDPDEKMLARRMKEVAMLRMKVEMKRKKAETANKQQAGSPMGTGQAASAVTAAPGVGY